MPPAEIHAENIVNWGISHGKDLNDIGSHSLQILAIVQTMKADFPTGGDFTILSEEQQQEVVMVELMRPGSHFQALLGQLPPGTLLKWFQLLWPIIQQFLNKTPPVATPAENKSVMELVGNAKIFGLR